MKLAILGGAGVRSVFFINGLAQKAKQMDIDEIVLFDIDEQKLETMGALCVYQAKKIDPSINVRISTDLRESVTNADYIVTTIRVGFDKSRMVDEEICLRNNVLGQETTGAGGFSMALRTIPVMLDYMKVINEVAKDAWIFNFTNPSGLVTQALRDAGNDRVLGICDAPSCTKIAMAKSLNVPTDELFVQFAGLNHLSFVTSVQLDGKEILPKLLQDDGFLKSVKEFSMFEPDLIRTIGHLPNEYLYYYYYRNNSLKNIQKAQRARGRVVMENNIAMFDELYKMDKKEQLEKMMDTYLRFMHNRESTYMNSETSQNLSTKPFDGQMPDIEGYAGVMMNYVLARKTGEEREMVISLPAGDSYYGLKGSDVMEVTCKISKTGVNIQNNGQLSNTVMPLINTIKTYEHLAVEAAKTRNKKTAVSALAIHPLVNDYPTAKTLVDEFIEANKEFLGEWN